MKNLLFVHGNSGAPVKLISVVFRQIYPYAGFQKDTCFANRNLPQSWQLLSVIIFGCLHVLLQFKVGTTCLRVLALPFVNSCLCHSEVYLVQMPILLLLLWNTCQGEQGSEAVESPPGELVLYRDSLNCFERIAYTKDVW
jgi:hypothetical protein